MKLTVNDIKPLFQGLKKSGKGFTALCPCHDDKNNSLSINSDNDGYAVVNCFSGCSQVDLWNYINSHVDRPQKAPKSPKKAIVEKYPYIDENGEIIDTKIRYNPKGFSWEITTAKRKATLPPYNLEGILSSPVIFAVEGEKDANRVKSLGYASTNLKDGFTVENKHYFTDKTVLIIPDNDTAGKKYAIKSAELIKDVARVKILDLFSICPTLPQKGDISDYLDLGGSIDELLTLAMKTDEYKTVEEITEKDDHPHTAIYKKIDGYFINKKGVLCFENSENSTPILYGSLIISEVIEKYNGVDKDIYFKVNGISTKGKELNPVVVSAVEFDSLSWIRKYYGCEIVLAPQSTAKNKVVTGLGLTSQFAPKKTVYTNTGYLFKDGSPLCYLHGNGSIKGGEISAELPNNLSQYSMVFGDQNKDEKQTALSSMELLTAHDKRVVYPLFAFTYLPPILPLLNDFIGDTGFCFYLQGKTQSGKSTLSSFVLSHYGRFTAMTPPVNFNSTANYINELAFYLKDSILWIDDYHPQGTKRDSDKQNQIFQNIARSSGDHAFRGRLNSSLKMVNNHKPRCLFLATGEDTPQIGQSGLARLFTVKVDKIRKDIKALKISSLNGDLALAMNRYINYILDNWNGLKGQINGLYEKAIEKAVNEFDENRLTQQTALLLLSAVIYCSYLRSKGFLSDDQIETLIDEFEKNIFICGSQLEDDINNSDPVTMYINALKSIISSGQRYVLNINSDIKYTSDNLGSKGDCIGWFDNAFYYLDSNSTYKSVCDFYKNENTFFNISKTTLNRELLNNGIIIGDQNNKPTIVKTINYKTVRVMRFKKEVLSIGGGEK